MNNCSRLGETGLKIGKIIRIVLAGILILVLPGAQDYSAFASAFARPPQKSAADALSELQQLFDRYGETDQAGRWGVASDEDITKARKIAESDPQLKDMEDWSFLESEDCSLWLTQAFSDQVSLYKIPLGKLKTPIHTYSKCDQCDGTLLLGTEDNEKAIITTLVTYSPRWISVTHENSVDPAFSSLRRADQAAADLSILIPSCRQRL